MSRTRGYKKTENNIVRYISKQIKKAAEAVLHFFKSVIAGGRKKLTIMIVPHSQKKVLNFQTSIFSLLFTLIAIIGFFSSFFWFAHKTAVSVQDLSATKEEARKAQASLDVLRDETNELLKTERTVKLPVSKS